MLSWRFCRLEGEGCPCAFNPRSVPIRNNSTTAPAVAVMIEPIKPPAANPSTPNRKPPTTAPYALMGASEPARAVRSPKSNTVMRLVGALNAWTGGVF